MTKSGISAVLLLCLPLFLGSCTNEKPYFDHHAEGYILAPQPDSHISVDFAVTDREFSGKLHLKDPIAEFGKVQDWSLAGQDTGSTTRKFALIMHATQPNGADTAFHLGFTLPQSASKTGDGWRLEGTVQMHGKSYPWKVSQKKLDWD